MSVIRIAVKDRHGRAIQEPWEETKFFCLTCGSRAVWCCEDGGDYYAGETYMCSSCGNHWSLPNTPRPAEEAQDKFRYDELMKAARSVPDDLPTL